MQLVNYGNILQRKRGNAMNCSDVIRERRSIRKFKKGAPSPQEHVHKILEAAMMAPSACNSRPWEFVVVESSKVKQQILEAHPYTQMLATASLAIIVCGRPDLQEGLSKGYWPQDCAAATSTMLLQAAELGYGTCWCGCYPSDDRVKTLQEILCVRSIPFSIVALGVPDESPKARGFFEESKVNYIR